MRSFGTRIRGSLAAALSAALIVSGVALAAPTVAYAAPAETGAVTNATLDWGFKASWRDYISGASGGPNSNPNPTVLAGGVTDAPAYRWGTSGTGTFSDSTLIGSFRANPSGSITWNRNHGPAQYIGVTLSDLVVDIDLSAGTGSISGTYSDSTRSIPSTTAVLANFVTTAETASVADGVVTVTGAPATAGPGITDFDYDIGEEMDPVSFSFDYVETPAPATVTTTTVSSSAATVSEGTDVDLTATVAPAEATGTVTFKNGETVLGDPVTVASGSATLSDVRLAAGTHTITAEFAPTDAAVYAASVGTTSVTVNASDPVIGGTAAWGVSGYLNSSNPGRPNPSPSNYVAPAAFDADTRISTWGSGTGTVSSDGSVHLEFSGKSVNHAKTGGGWLTLANLEVDLDEDGNGVMSAEVAYGTATPPSNFDPDQTPVRGSARVNVLDIQGNSASPVVAGGTSTWSDLASVWHADFLAFLAGDSEASPVISGWSYGSTVTNDGDDNRKPSPITFSVKTAAPVSYSATVTGANESGLTIGADFAGATGMTIPPGQGKPGASEGVYIALVEEGTAGSLSPSNRGIAAAFVPNGLITDGAGSAVLSADAGDLDRTKSYEVVFWYAHANATTDTTIGTTDLVVSDAQWDALFPEDGDGGGTGGEGGTDTNTGAVQTAGALRWGIKTSFVNYLNGLSDGGYRASGVGGSFGNWLFPQSGSTWDAASSTGTVSYSGSLTFYGHGQDMLTLANPVIRVSSAQNATLSSGGVHIANLNLAAANRSVGSGGDVTWTNAPATLTAAGGAFFAGFYTAGTALDPVTFTVGATSTVSFGSSAAPSAAAAAQNRTPASTPPATEGVTVVTPDEEIVPGGEVEIEAEGFESNERDILVVVYSEPIVLDRQAGANADGKVRWIGTIPEDLEPGQHTLTLQGSINVGKVITVLDADEAKAAKAVKKLKTAADDGELAEATAGPSGGDASTAWVWWAGAIGLLIVAGGLTALVVAQRRRQGVE